jgi:multicomponent Na+:H+ antiporter subunit D
MNGSLLPLTVALPIAGAVLAPLLARISGRLTLYAAIPALGGSTAILLMLAPTVYDGRPLTHFMGHITPVRGQALGIAFTADPLGLTFALVTASIGILLLVYSLSELSGLADREMGGYAALFQLLLAALVGAALTGDLFNLFVWFEVAALSSYGLTGFFLERPIALEAGFKILVLTTIAGFGIFVGSGMLYSEHGALNLGQLHNALGKGVGTADTVALVLLVSGYATKAGLIPFHGWLADAHTAAPGLVSALFSGLMVNMGVLAVARLVFQVYGTSRLPVLGLLMALGLVSAVVGSVLALAQDDLKRLLAYDTISQMGVLAVGFGTGSATGVSGAVYHLVNHALFKSLLFLCAGAIVHRTGLTKLSEMGGLARRMPVVTVAFLVGTASIAGIPPLNGYASLSLIHHALLDSDQFVPVALLTLAQVVTTGALAKAAWKAFFMRRSEEIEWRERPRAGMVIGFLGLSACCVAFGALPGQILDHMARPAASGLLNAGAYAHAALGGRVKLPHVAVPLDYFDPLELVLTAICLGLGLALAWAYPDLERDPQPVRALRALHNGSVNDYTAYAVAGTVVLAVLLRWA